MVAKWINRDHINLSKITSKIEACKTIDKSLNVSFRSDDFNNYRTILYNFLKVSELIPNLEKKRILNKALFECGKVGSITPDNLILEIRKFETQYFKNPLKRFVLLSYFSIPRQVKIKDFKENNKLIKFPLSLSNKFIEEANKIYDVAKHSINVEPPKYYSFTKIFVYARTPIEAAKEALNFLDYFRSIWNLAINRNQNDRQSFGGPPKPINRFFVGPISTLHDLNGNIAVEMWWYDSEHRTPVSNYDPTKDLTGIYEYESFVRKRLKKITYRNKIINAIINYGRALDSINHRNTFLNLWCVLEQLTFTAPKDGYNITIDRLSFLFENREYHKVVLEQLRNLRNIFTHQNQSEDNEILETILFQLKNYVELLIEFHLNMGFKFDNPNEALQFLNSPYNLKDIKKKLGLLKLAEKFINK
jgi:hypothetical protein